MKIIAEISCSLIKREVFMTRGKYYFEDYTKIISSSGRHSLCLRKDGLSDEI